MVAREHGLTSVTVSTFGKVDKVAGAKVAADIDSCKRCHCDTAAEEGTPSMTESVVSIESGVSEPVDVFPSYKVDSRLHQYAYAREIQVIKALYPFNNPMQDSSLLSFEQGDFLYVIGREHDPDWYEACNPQSGVRGLVPVNHFEEQGKHVKSTSHTLTSRSSGTGGHDSGYSEKSSDGGGMNGTGVAVNGHDRLRSNAAKGMVIYGMVSFDFKAERTDELDARAGEPIVVVAQSNSEWFVAKPITRLGGPGLIPVAFIEIRDSVTQKPVENTLEAVQRAGVPTVEEWKKMAAEYKNSSIPLGRLDTTQTVPLQQSMQRMSIASSARPSHDTSRHGSDVRPFLSGPFQPILTNFHRHDNAKAVSSFNPNSPTAPPK